MYIPFKLVFGRKPFVPGLLQSRPQYPDYSKKYFVSVLKGRLQYSHEAARRALINSKEISKKYYDQRENTVNFREGDRELLSQENVRRGSSKKLSSLWIGIVITPRLKFQVSNASNDQGPKDARLRCTATDLICSFNFSFQSGLGRCWCWWWYHRHVLATSRSRYTKTRLACIMITEGKCSFMRRNGNLESKLEATNNTVLDFITQTKGISQELSLKPLRLANQT